MTRCNFSSERKISDNYRASVEISREAEYFIQIASRANTLPFNYINYHIQLRYPQFYILFKPEL